MEEKELMSLTPKDRERIQWIMSFRAGRKFVEKFEAKERVLETIASYVVGIQRFCEFVGKDPDQIVDEYIADVKANPFEAFGKWEDTLTDYGGWVRKKYGLSGSSPASMHAGAKALINSNVPKTLALKAEVPEYESKTIPGVTIEDLRILDKACDERERVIIRFLKDSGMSLDDAARLRYKDIRHEFERGEQFVHLNVYRAKEKVEYETFIGPNTVEALKVYFNARQRRGENFTDETPIFTVEGGMKPLTEGAVQRILARLQQRTGITVSSHRLRKFFETYLSTEIRHPIWLKYWMGHKVRGKRADIEGRYIIPPTEEQRKAYMAAYHRIDLTPALDEKAMRIKAMKDQARIAGVPEEKLDLIDKLFYARRVELQIPEEYAKEVEKAIRERRGNPCFNGENCEYRQIHESQLLQHLREGWQIVHNQRNGDVIVKR